MTKHGRGERGLPCSPLVACLVLALLAPAGSPARAMEPSDPEFGRQWALRNTGQEVEYRRGTPGADVDAVPAWDLATGEGVVIAVVDTGVHDDQPELAGRMWSNPGIPALDGCPAGTHGYDFHQGDCDPDDTNGHGTNVAGIAAAAGGNGVGGLGLAWGADVMALRVGMLPVLNASTDAYLAKGIRWAVEARQHGVNVRVVNLSWGGDFPSDGIRQAIEEAAAAGILVVTGSGNADRNNDAQPTYPCSFDVPTMICVGGSDQDDRLIWNWGPTTVDLVAPAWNLYALPGDENGAGTSLAAPFVAATAALIWSREPHLSVAEVRGKILTNVDPLPDPADRAKIATGGRLNAYRALTGPSGVVPTTSTTAPPAGGGPGGGPGGGGGGGGPGGGAPLVVGGGGSPVSGSGGGGGAQPGRPGSGTGGTTSSGGGARRGSSPTRSGTAATSGGDGDTASSVDPGRAAGLDPAASPGGGVRVTLDDGPGGAGRWMLGAGAAAVAAVAFAGTFAHRRRRSAAGSSALVRDPPTPPVADRAQGRPLP